MRKRFDEQFKANVALEAVKEERQLVRFVLEKAKRRSRVAHASTVTIAMTG